MEDPKSRLIVALDVDTETRAVDLVKRLKPFVGIFKIGMQLFYSAGPRVVRRILDLGVQVFLDLKMHDIPNTVAAATRVLTRLEVSIINVHAPGGYDMMRSALAAADDEAGKLNIKRPAIIAVTVLTSIDNHSLNQRLGIPGTVGQCVLNWSVLARDAGLDGVVASPREVAEIREACGPHFMIVTPGVRPAGSEAGDQKRIMTPGDAIKAGATHLVIGRPITAAARPEGAAEDILRKIKEALGSIDC